MSNPGMTFAELYKVLSAAHDQYESCLKNYKKTALNKRTKTNLINRLEALDKYFANFSEQHFKITSVATSQEKNIEYFKEERFAQLEDQHIEVKSEIQESIERLESLKPKSSSPVVVRDPEVAHPQEVRLPSIPLPRFNGEYNTWTSFRDLFTSIIHSNASLNAVQKLHYLKSSLDGEAESLLRHYQITEANYVPAWECLNKRFENKRILVKEQLKTLFKQPYAQESAQGIRRLINTTNEVLQSLRTLGIDISTWDPMLIHIVTQKVPSETHQLWEQSLGANGDLPQFEEFMEFLNGRFRTLEMIGSKVQSSPVQPPMKPYHHKSIQMNHTKVGDACSVCQGYHATYQCQRFIQANYDKKIELLKEKNLCNNCLRPGHVAYKCLSKSSCYYCHKRHHSLLHRKVESNVVTSNIVQQNPSVSSVNSIKTSAFQQIPSCSGLNNFETSQNVTSYHSSQVQSQHQVLLATAIVNVIASNGKQVTLRALLDQGSQASFVTESVVQSLNLRKTPINTKITGIGKSEGCISHNMVSISVGDRLLKTIIPVDVFVLKTLTDILPGKHIDFCSWEHLEGIELADPNYFEPGRVDLLLGAEIYAQILQDGLRKGELGAPIAQKTSLGWILSGRIQARVNQIPEDGIRTFTTMISEVQDDLSEVLKKFWEIEEVPAELSRSNEEELCETLYQQTVNRDNDGRYILQLPFKDQSSRTFGRSRHVAIARLLQLEQKFTRNPEMQREYGKCMREYETLGHMEPVQTLERDNIASIQGPHTQYTCNYLPHHAVFKESSSTKTRVVFDASNKNADGISLNDKLLIGPSIQDLLVNIILRWRKYKIAFTADLHKMYRQIKVVEKDADCQRIVWRDKCTEPIKDFRLTTVTFGTACAPFLAIRTLRQLACDEAHRFPLATRAVEREFYVDDLLSGADTIKDAEEKQGQLVDLMKAGKFELMKWTANEPELLRNIPEEYIEARPSKEVESSNTVKTLGLYWNAATDNFTYKIKQISINHKTSKRIIVSEVAKLFDPMGWVAPIIITGKIFIQRLWLLGINWDDDLPTEFTKEWVKYREQLKDIDRIQIPRWIRSTQSASSVEIHGFSDASNVAYAAAVYSRIEMEGEVTVSLLAAKTKVAPLKKISLPRLELCGAALLARLMKTILEAIEIGEVSLHAWCDSKIVLDWLRGNPNRWTTFVSNRTSQINADLRASWRYVPSAENPADCASRGITSLALIDHKLWWCGPIWLKQDKSTWPKMEYGSTDIEQKVLPVVCNLAIPEIDDLLRRYSSLRTLVRITALCFRFINNLQKRKCLRSMSWVTTVELQKANLFWIKYCQSQDFPVEIQYLKDNKCIPAKSKILSLTPFIDKDGILRVGGRLQQSNLTFNQKHPILIDHRNHFAKLIIEEAHKQTLHGGPQLMMAHIRRTYWITNLRNTIRHHIHKCMECYRYNVESHQQLMGNLPRERINIAKPFFHTGVDYCGPFDIKASMSRSPKIIKCYIAIFVCMATKATHIEIVSNLTSDAFIAAFKRFIGRRGFIGEIHMYSDNGTNFVGASKQLLKDIKLATNNEDVANMFTRQGIRWHFIPPRAPNFGGLWEATVKATKYHMKRVLRNAKLTFEEMTTTLVQIEACLNSRPLLPMNNDPNDLGVLTAGHFLTGDAILAIPEPSLLYLKDNRLNRWQYIQKLYQSFWKMWSQNYLSTLQQRPKWTKTRRNIEKGALVLIKEDNLPPCKWALGRITETHEGTDGLVRVVTLKTKDNLMKRPISKICFLPIDYDEELQN